MFVFPTSFPWKLANFLFEFYPVLRVFQEHQNDAYLFHQFG